MEDNRFIKWLKPIIAAVLILVISAFSRGLFSAADGEELFKDLSDCFFITGIILSGVGAISWSGTEGTFDMDCFQHRMRRSCPSRSMTISRSG